MPKKKGDEHAHRRQNRPRQGEVTTEEVAEGCERGTEHERNQQQKSKPEYQRKRHQPGLDQRPKAEPLRRAGAPNLVEPGLQLAEYARSPE